MDPVTHTAPVRPAGAALPGPAMRWVTECLGRGAEIRMVRPLPGGAHVNHALLVETRSGHAHRLVLRRWRPRERPAAEFSPEREIAALALLAGCELPTPSLVAADPAGAYCDAPALLVTRLNGHRPRPAPDELPEYLIQLAAALTLVHGLRGASSMPPHVPANRLDVRLPPRHALRPQLWERAFDVAAGPAPHAPSRFLHRDYEPDNTLWTYGRLTGVVDWSEAAGGPAAVDVARMRLALLARHGRAAADRFLQVFDQVSGGHAHDPYWDVRCLLDLLPEEDGRVLDRTLVPYYEDYLAGLLAELGAPATG
ncbi:phosphotransferase family protein [Actinomadura kijaniata]|uniref:phosphotransferase family protein n=1 Tax=Actinomadura kijaniata TaxID=46161 RepID=UPI00082FD7C2|nr:aminoglycoside phosphotransferase family protein [Actinomadura kijaniata]